MTKISLRAYIQEINQLIENKNIADAIEHCKHILKQFPKHLEIYRLLGQAYLESGDYEESSDMFLRVLSVTPDDFIAQVGLSMIMEEQGDVDSAIWHMERAYEVRNTQAIHEELHRLYLLRDGVAPAKPMITRGALIRINIRSGLYQQALQEIQRALSSDPSRIDLKILEARIHYMQTNIPKTIRTCESVLKKLPYSYQANSLMAEIHGEMPDAEPYKSKLYELNPYTSFVTENNTIDSVPDNVLRIEKLNLEEAYQDDFQLDSSSIQFGDFGQVVDQNPENTPDTAKTDRMKTKPKASPTKSTDEDDIDLPEYLTNEETTTLEDSTMLEAEAEDGTEIPDWMKQAGWGAAEERSLEEQQNLIHNFDNTIESKEAAELISEDIIESDIPDWLQNIAPDTDFNEIPPVIDKLPEETSPQEEENLEWLNDILTTSSESPSGENPEADFETLAEEIQPAVSAEADQPEFGEDIDKDLAWLQDITSPEENTKGETLMEDNIFNDDMFEEDHSEEQEEQNSETLPELSNLSQPSDISETNDSPVPVEDSKTEEQISPDAEDEEEDFDLDSALSWLEGLAAKQGADEEALATAPEERIAEKPDFLTTESSPESIIDEPALEQDAEPLSEPFPEYNPELEEIPDWLQEESPIDSDQFTSPEELPASEELDTLPEGMFAEEAIDDSEDEIAPPPWLKAVAPPEKILEEDEILTTEDIESPTNELTSEQTETSGKRASDHPTMALDFIKDDEKTEKEADIDEWLKNLPDMDWDMDEPGGEDLPTPETTSLENSQTPEESLEEISDQPEFGDEKDTGFIDELFEAPTETENDISEPIAPGSPYVWENEFSTQEDAASEEPIPDWISDIADEDQIKTPQEEPIQEMPSEFQEIIPTEEEPGKDFSIEEMSDDEMPDWMLDTSEIEIEESAQEVESEIQEPDQIQGTQLTETDEFVSVEDIEAYSEISTAESDSPAMDETMDISTSELKQLSEEDKHIADESSDEISTSAPTVPMQEEIESTPIIAEEPTQPEEVEEFIAEEVQEEAEVLQEKVEEESLAPAESLLPVSEILSGAKEDLINGDFEEAHRALETLLEKKSNTDEIIEVLKFDIEHYHPIQVDSWVLLGDAYMQKGDLEKALDAYTKAEDFIY